MPDEQVYEKDRFMYALGHHNNKSVFSIPKTEWENGFLSMGYNCTATAYFKDPPAELSQVCTFATVVGVELSLKEDEPKPMDIIRFDSKDDPYVYNRDRYKVFNNPCLATSYPVVLEKYGIRDTPELRQYLEDHVLLIGPYKNIPGHHSSQVAATLLRLNHEDS